MLYHYNLALIAKQAYTDCTYSNPETGAQVLVTSIGEKHVIAFRGTDDMKDVKTDLNIRRICIERQGGRLNEVKPGWLCMFNLCSHMQVHKGFFTQYISIRDNLRPKPNTVFVGHSLGGALAILASLDFHETLGTQGTLENQESVTFGSPRVGNYIFARNIKGNHTRYVHAADPIQFLPSILRFRHHCDKTIINRNINPHSMDGYISNYGALMKTLTKLM